MTAPDNTAGAGRLDLVEARVERRQPRQYRSGAPKDTMPGPATALDTTDAQRTAAKFVGAAYLAAIPLAFFSNLYVPGQLVVATDAAATAQNIVAHERLARLGVGSDLLAFRRLRQVALPPAL